MCKRINKTIIRNLSFRKVQNWYANLHKPPKPSPPYSHVIQIGDPILRQPAESVPPNLIKSDEIKYLIKNLKSVTDSYDCVALAAPQIGISLRVFVMEFDAKKRKEFSAELFKNRKMSLIPFTVFINPELKITDYNKIVLPEACESVRGFSADVPRYSAVQITGLNENGEEVNLNAEGWTARIIQHEFDHLKGKMFTDIMDRKSLCCTCWEAVNERAGKIEMPFLPSK